jgi:acyl-CoA thioesterase FadM
VQYKKPTFATQYIVVRTSLTSSKGRRAWVEGRIESLKGEVLVEAQALFVEPKMAKFLVTSSVRDALA